MSTFLIFLCLLLLLFSSCVLKINSHVGNFCAISWYYSAPVNGLRLLVYSLFKSSPLKPPFHVKYSTEYSPLCVPIFRNHVNIQYFVLQVAFLKRRTAWRRSPSSTPWTTSTGTGRRTYSSHTGQTDQRIHQYGLLIVSTATLIPRSVWSVSRLNRITLVASHYLSRSRSNRSPCSEHALIQIMLVGTFIYPKRTPIRMKLVSAHPQLDATWHIRKSDHQRSPLVRSRIIVVTTLPPGGSQ